MTDYNSIPNSDIDPESPITTTLMTWLRDNPLAMFEAAAGAPRMQGSAIATGTIPAGRFANNAVTVSVIADNSVDQGAMLDSAIGQAELKLDVSNEQSNSITAGSSWEANNTGGYYMLAWKTRWSNSGISAAADFRWTCDNSTSYAGPRFIFNNNHATNSYTAYFNEYFVDASPPYDLGYGVVGSFVFLLIDNTTSDVLATYISKTAPWHYHGPTNITPDEYRSDGTPIKRMKQIQYDAIQRGESIQQLLGANIASGNFDQMIQQFKDDPVIEVDIDQSIKNADMIAIPHPFLQHDLTGKTVVALNPNCTFMRQLSDFHDQISFSEDFSFADEFFYSNRLNINNVAVTGNSGFDNTILCVDATLR